MDTDEQEGDDSGGKGYQPNQRPIGYSIKATANMSFDRACQTRSPFHIRFLMEKSIRTLTI
jgi:hypothetical protein